MDLNAIREILANKGKVLVLKRNYSEEEKNYMFHIEFENGDIVNFVAGKSGEYLDTSKLLPAINWMMRDKAVTKNIKENQFLNVMSTYSILCEVVKPYPKEKTKHNGKSVIDYLRNFKVRPDIKPSALNTFVSTSSKAHMPNFRKR
jgi:hypothetical protein